jgi:hypothetical protein
MWRQCSKVTGTGAVPFDDAIASAMVGVRIGFVGVISSSFPGVVPRFR